MVTRPHWFDGEDIVDPCVEILVAEPLKVRRLTDQEGQRMQQIVRRGSTNHQGQQSTSPEGSTTSSGQLPRKPQEEAAKVITSKRRGHLL
jgi:hypothetical protein